MARIMKKLLLSLTLMSTLTSAARATSVFGNGKGLPLAGLVDVEPYASAGHSVKYRSSPNRYSPLMLTRIKKQGFDHVRLLVAVEPLLTENAKDRAVAINEISVKVDQAIAANLGIVVNLHPWATGPTRISQDSIVPDARNLAALMRAQVEIARVLRRKQHNAVAFEILNEPPCHPEGSWLKAQQDIVSRIRRVAPVLALVLTSCRNRIDSLIAIDPTRYVNDTNIYWSFHYYQPSIFVEQTQKRLTSVPFPPLPALANLDEALNKMVTPAAVGANPQIARQTRKYLLENRGQKSIAADFDQVAAWARRNGISLNRVWMGEWGSLIENGPAAEKVRSDNLRYLSAMRREAEHHGFAWNVFGMGKNSINVDAKAGFVRHDVLEALGVKARF